jgi:cysteine desulfurase
MSTPSADLAGGTAAGPVNLDAASGVPLHPAAREALLVALDEGWADPARRHASGRRSRQLLDAARASVAAAVGARPDEVSFTPGGAVALQLAVLGTAASRTRAGGVVLHSAVEQSVVLQSVQQLDAEGADVRSLPVDGLGRVLPFDLPDGTALVCLQSVNHEVGTRQPVAEVAARCGDVPLLVDATASLGRAPVPTGWSVLAGAASGWGGPAGAGVLVVRAGTRWRSPLPDDERPDRAPGAPDVPAIVAAAVALEAAVAESATEDARLRPLVDRLRARLPEVVPGCAVLGDPVDRLPHLVTAAVDGVRSEELQEALDRRGLLVSAGSSCSASSVEPSHVLAAMGAPTEGTLRVSLHRGTRPEDVDRLLAALPAAVAELRA